MKLLAFIHWMPWRKSVWTMIALLLSGLAGCNLPGDVAASPTVNVTQAYQTVEARLTQAVAQTPQSTSSPAPTDQGVGPSPSPSNTPSGNGSTPSPTLVVTGTSAANLCDLAAPGVPIDVTIPDDTRMQPGEEFTKTWRLVNVGSCTWTNDYRLVWFSGEQFGAQQSVPLSGSVPPNGTIDISVDMEAPQSPGSYISYWKLRNPSGELFGIGPSGGSAFWVQIVVVPSTTVTVSPTPGTTLTPTITPTTIIQASGSATLQPGDVIDLDTIQVNSGDGDLAYREEDQAHLLVPQGSGVGFAVLDSGPPSLSDCQTRTLVADPLPVAGLAEGTYLCYRTDMALPGWARIAGYNAENGELSLEINTWEVP
jgi:hypothetical protein